MDFSNPDLKELACLMVAEDHSIDLKDLKRWAKVEGFEKKLEEFLRRVKT